MLERPALSALLERMATMVELAGGPPEEAAGYRATAHAVAAAPVETGDALANGQWDDLPVASAELVALAAGGETARLTELRRAVPAGLLSLLELPGLGLAKVRQIHEALGVTGLAELATAVRDGRVEALPRFGKKTVARLSQAIEEALASMPEPPTQATPAEAPPVSPVAAAARRQTAPADLAALPFPDRSLARLLLDAGVLQPEQISRAAGLKAPTLWHAVVKQGWADDQVIMEVVARRHRVPVADLARLEPAAATLIPEALARKHRIVPLGADDRTIRVATADPSNLDVEQTVAFVSDRRARFELAPPGRIEELLDELYRPELKIARLLDSFAPSRVEALDADTTASGSGDTLEAPIARLVDALIADAVRKGASDIHAEPVEGALVVRQRIDGVLSEVMRLPQAAGTSLVRRVKVWARLDVTDPLRPHDGRAALRVDGKMVDLRIATSPVARRGEKVVLRILDKTHLQARLKDIGLAPLELETAQGLFGIREGLILVTGPTGSGKTTTLYAAINQLKTGRVNIVTVEDPVEYDVDGISQIQVNEAQGLTFASTLRSVLRQDPDIVLVGEIRDLDTAKTAVQAGLSGHLVLSTLHTNDAPSAVVRLRDLGLDSFKIAAVLKGIIAQRLVRKLCTVCAEPVPLTDVPPEARPPAGRSDVTILKSVGCRACSGFGYKGRMAVLEVMPITPDVAALIDRDQPVAALASVARQAGRRTLWESGLDRVWRGLTSLDELVRVLGEHTPEDGMLPPEPAAPLVPRTVTGRTVAPADVGPDPAPRTDGAAHILIVDDDPQMRRLVRTVLERDGHRITEAEDGLDALDVMERGHYDLMLLDLDMPRLDGIGVLEELRARPATVQLPVIMLTARSADESESAALDLGAQDFLTKPVRPASLGARVRAVLRRAGM